MEDKKHTHFIEVWSGYKNKPHNTECVEIEKLPIYLKITEEYMFCKTVAIWKIKLK